MLESLGVRVERRRMSPLERMRVLGVAPRTVIDVGAAYGDWSADCQLVFPEAQYVLVEPLAEFEPLLAARAADLGAATVVGVAAAPVPGDATFHVHDDLVGSSLLLETEGAAVDGIERTVPALTVDEISRGHGAGAPYLLKVDVQGAELEVLSGARSTLAESVAVILEVSFFGFFEGGPQFHDVVAWMHDAQFVVYDLIDLMYRPLDGALAQADVVFVPESSPVRRSHAYATVDQRVAQNARFRAEYERRQRIIG
jgi:FkbM family methyltransferase